MQVYFSVTSKTGMIGYNGGLDEEQAEVEPW